MLEQRYNVFALATAGPRPVRPTLEGRYLTLWECMLRGYSLYFAYVFCRWKLVCMLYAKISMPDLYVVERGGKLVHYSFVLPALGRVPGMAWGDIEIGPCWTAASVRRQGLFRGAIQRIVADYHQEDRVIWMITRVENTASSEGIARAGFIRAAVCRRERRRFPPLAAYRKGDPGARETSLRPERDLLVEQARYNKRAKEILETERGAPTHGAAAIDLTLREPYVRLHELIAKYSGPGLVVVDLCCGDGIHSLTGAQKGAKVVAIDIAEAGLKLAQMRANANGVTIETRCANIEAIPLPSASAHLVTCAGGLSYADHGRVIAEVRRILAADGKFVFVDTYNRNWIYRLNRWLQYLGARRTRSTIERMPDQELIALLRRQFREVRVEYYGICVFLIPILERFVRKEQVADFIKWTDERLAWFRQWSFKIVVECCGGDA